MAATLYADDVGLSCRNDLQNVEIHCVLLVWRLEINKGKTQIMYFRKMGELQTKFKFHFG